VINITTNREVNSGGREGGGYNYDSTSIRPPFDSHSTANRPRYDHSTTYVTTVGLTVMGCCTAT